MNPLNSSPLCRRNGNLSMPVNVSRAADCFKVKRPLFQEKAAELLDVYKRSEVASRSLLSFQELAALSSHVCADESSLCMALLQLQREKLVTVSLHEGEKVKWDKTYRERTF